MKRIILGLLALATPLILATPADAAVRHGAQYSAWLKCPVYMGSDKHVRIVWDVVYSTKSSPTYNSTTVEWLVDWPDIASGSVKGAMVVLSDRWGGIKARVELPTSYPGTRGEAYGPTEWSARVALNQHPVVFVTLRATNGSDNCVAGPFRP